MAAVAEPNCRNDVAAEPQELPGPHFVGSVGGGAADTGSAAATASPRKAAEFRVKGDGLGIFGILRRIDLVIPDLVVLAHGLAENAHGNHCGQRRA